MKRKDDNSKENMVWIVDHHLPGKSSRLQLQHATAKMYNICLIGVGVLSYIPCKHCDILYDNHHHHHYYHKVHLLTCPFSSYLASITIQSSDLRISYYLASMVTFSPAIIWSTA